MSAKKGIPAAGRGQGRLGQAGPPEPILMPKERPILFSAPMVRAILDGSKTQTRRVVKPTVKGCKVGVYTTDRSKEIELCNFDPEDGDPVDGRAFVCPYGQPGDRLWVRESLWNEDGDWNFSADDALVTGQSDRKDWLLANGSKGAIPSIHMPRWASRIMLEVVDVKVERAQEISEADAIAEGTRAVPVDAFKPRLQGCFSERDAFAQIWQRINGKDSWDANPWVWALSFRRA